MLGIVQQNYGPSWLSYGFWHELQLIPQLFSVMSYEILKRNPEMPKFVLCRPQGGLNDIFCQIEKCCQYADKFGRIVVVDTAYEKSENFWDTFSNYFVSKQERLLLDAQTLSPILKLSSLHPRELKGMLDLYEFEYGDKARICVIEGVTVDLTFDFTRDYEEDVLLHHQAGGGLESKKLAKRISINENTMGALVTRLNLLPDYFDAVHVRHTDLQSNCEAAIQHFKIENSKALFVATDNFEVLQEFRRELGSDRIYSFSAFPNVSGQTLHKRRYNDIEVAAINRDAILDLFTLSFAEELILCRNTNNVFNDYSGYSLLARAMHEDKNIRDQFLLQKKSTK